MNKYFFAGILIIAALNINAQTLKLNWSPQLKEKDKTCARAPFENIFSDEYSYFRFVDIDFGQGKMRVFDKALNKKGELAIENNPKDKLRNFFFSLKRTAY
jgi:hypothetical protein